MPWIATEWTSVSTGLPTQKHAAVENLSADHIACLASLQRVSSRLLGIEKARDRAAKLRRQGKTPAVLGMDPSCQQAIANDAEREASLRYFRALAEVELANQSKADKKSKRKSMARGAPAPAPAPPPPPPSSYVVLALSAHQRTLLSAVVTALQEKGIGMGGSAWANAGLKLGLREAMNSKLRSALPDRIALPGPDDVLAAVAELAEQNRKGKGPDAAEIAKRSGQSVVASKTLRQGEKR